MRKLIVFFFLLTVGISAAWAQPEFSLYRMNGNLAEANLLNPAFAPNNKLVIGLPAISSLYVSEDMDGLAFNDIFRSSENDSLELDTVSLFKALKPVNRIKAKESVQLFYFGLRGQKSYFSFGIHHVTETRFHYPGDVVGWAIRGPADPHYIGKPLNLSDFYGKAIAYNKVSVNYGRDITSKLRLGARFNYLLGVASAETNQISGKLTVGIDSVNINTGTLQLQTAGIDYLKQRNLSPHNYVNYFLKGSTGISWDFGGTYQVTNNVTLSAALNDLGFISWKDYTRTYTVAPVNYTFKGFDMLDYLNQNGGQQSIDAERDSLENLFKATETTGAKFKTSLIGKFYAGINFRLLRISNFSMLFYADMFQKRIDPALSLGYNLQLGRLLNATVGITYQNKTISNIGAGLAFKLAYLQFYGTSDRANSFIYPARASRHDARVGMNLVFGKVKKKDNDKDKDDEKKEEETAEAVKEEEKKEPEVTPEKVTEDPAPAAVLVPVAAAVAAGDTQPADTNPAATETAPPQREIVSPVLEEPKTEPVVEQPTPVVAEEVVRHETVKRGTHPEELAVSNYVIVGTFKQRVNAARYSRQLRAAGYDNEFGFVSNKKVYYVFVHHSESADESRSIRNQYREKSDFQFAESWLLTVED
jgi:hypothetical protein